MTESEMVKEAALARDDKTPAGTPQPDEQSPIQASQSKAPPIENPVSASILLSPTMSTNPIESSISTQRSGWASFFMTTGLLTKSVLDSDANKLHNNPQNGDGMEVMNIDDDDDVAHEVHIGPVTESSQALAVVSASDKQSPVPPSPPSSTPKAPVPPLSKEE